MVLALRAFLEFCYIARRNVQDTLSLGQLEDALSRFHKHRAIFQSCGVRHKGFSLPRQHSLVHYVRMIRLFGAPNGICSSITESKHIKAVKEPWRRSSRFEALGQMLLINQRLEKLAASRADFMARDMLKGDVLQSVLSALGDVGELVYSSALAILTAGTQTIYKYHKFHNPDKSMRRSKMRPMLVGVTATFQDLGPLHLRG
jgi:hypothetical protein